MELDKIVKMKGNRDGLLFILQPKPALDDIKDALVQHLSTLQKKSSNSLSGIGLTLDIGGRHLEDQELQDIQQSLNQQFGADIKRIIMNYPKRPTFPEIGLNIAAAPTAPQQRTAENINTLLHAYDSTRTQSEETISDEDVARVIRHTLRSGQHEQFLDGNLLVIGDVNSGAEVIAGRDIIVLGALRGVAHAGASDDTSAVIIALNLIPTQLRIGNIISQSPAMEKHTGVCMEIARVSGKNIIVEEYRSL